MLVIGIILFALLVVVHELGHFLVARRNGVAVEEFGIGFPPRLIARRLGKARTLYSLNLIPLGGFVKLKGESNADNRPHSFGAAAFGTKAKILLAGVVMNIAAVYLILLMLAFTGLPSLLPGQFSIGSDERAKRTEVVIAQIEPDSAAARAGLKQGDKITRLGSATVTSGESLRSLTAEQAGQAVDLEFRRNNQIQSLRLQLGTDEQAGFLGVVPVDVTIARYGWSAPLVAAGVTLQLLWATLTAIILLVLRIFSGGGREAAESVTGPVGVFFLLQNVGHFGWSFVLLLIASISASLAIINGLPIPALDGGRLAVIGLARLFKRRLSTQVENLIHGIGFAILISLVILISYLDVQRFF